MTILLSIFMFRVNLNKQVIPICLPKNNEITHKKAIATGWGHTQHEGNASEILMKVRPIFSLYCYFNFKKIVSEQRQY